jgi:hypothetical protein
MLSIKRAKSGVRLGTDLLMSEARVGGSNSRGSGNFLKSDQFSS